MRNTCILFLILLTTGCTSSVENSVFVIGEMRNTMRNNALEGIIALDTLTPKNNLYGLGPVENLKGEVMILDGRTYVSSIVSDTAYLVEEMSTVRAPFFAYGHQSRWTATELPTRIQTISDLENYIQKVYEEETDKPIFFRIQGTLASASYHIMNLPPGQEVHSPEEAHQARVNLEMKKEEVEILGFFSRNSKGVFTHHDSSVHLHIINADRSAMGHLDEMMIGDGTFTLFLPVRDI